MRKTFSFITAFAISIALVSCGGGGASMKTNEFLGELPSLEKKYYSEIKEKEKKAEECTDMEEAFKLSKEAELLEKEKKQKIEEYIAANPLTKPVPFEALEGTRYTINGLVINKAQSGNLNLKLSMKINEDIKNEYGGIEKSLFIYYKAVDSRGIDIPDSKTVATNFKRIKLTTGTDYEAFGSWKSSEIMKMEDFAKVVEITKEEYDKK